METNIMFDKAEKAPINSDNNNKIKMVAIDIGNIILCSSPKQRYVTEIYSDRSEKSIGSMSSEGILGFYNDVLTETQKQDLKRDNFNGHQFIPEARLHEKNTKRDRFYRDNDSVSLIDEPVSNTGCCTIL